MTLRLVPRAPAARLAAGALLVLAAAAGLASCVQAVVRATAAQHAVEQEPPRDPRRTGTWHLDRARVEGLIAAAAATCPPVQPGEIYRFVAGVDACMVPMDSGDVSAELNDPWAVNVLRPNAGGQGPWPDDVASVVAAVGASPAAYTPVSYMVGEGSQIPPSVTPVTSSRDLRYVITFGPNAGNPVIFLSARPAEVQGGTPPEFLQVISYDPNKRKFNYYQYVDNADVGGDTAGGADGTPTWAWAGDSGGAMDSRTAVQGCFMCHLNGGLNMKERTLPWNNWNSTAALIPPGNVPPALRTDPLFSGLLGANGFEIVYEAAQQNLMLNWITGNVQGGQASSVPLLLARLFQNTTVNLASSQVQSTAAGDVAGLPSEIFLPDSILSSVLGLRYSFPGANIPRAAYNAFVADQQFVLVNTSAGYQQPGATFFAGFVPVPSYEDRQGIRVLLMRKVVSSRFVGAATMVDFTNPVFSPVRGSLQQYANQIPTGRADTVDIPTRFAALAATAAASQPPCDTTAVTGCTAEQQFLFYWNHPSWQAAAQNRVGAYLDALSARMSTTAGQNDVMALIVSRGVQFQSFWPICNLAEFSLLLPQTALGDLFVRMDADATLKRVPPYACRPGSQVAPVRGATAAVPRLPDGGVGLHWPVATGGGG